MNLTFRLALALYRLALRLYPRPFRHTFGAEMEEAFQLALADATSRGGHSLLWLILREVAGVCAGALAEQLRSGRYRWPAALLALALLMLLATQYAPLLIVVQIVLLPWPLIVVLRSTRGNPALQHRLGLAALVASWAALAFWGAVVVEGWQYNARTAKLAGDLSALAQFYAALLSLNLRRIEYGYLIVAASVALCTVRLLRAPWAAGAPAVLALSNLAITWVYLLYQLLPLHVPSVNAALSEADTLSAVHQMAVVDMSVALTLLVGLLLFQALVPLPKPGGWPGRGAGAPGAPHPTR